MNICFDELLIDLYLSLYIGHRVQPLLGINLSLISEANLLILMLLYSYQ